ncbi:MAG: acyl-CoA dehydrogenase family protein [Firmicutes bacterium]|nr:acyl-CoA dehydrogenase family protein [Bacillota bacterium]
MVNFKLSNELSLQQELYRRFAETELKPIAAEADETETFPMDVWKKVAKYGMLGIPFPAEYEGSGSNNLSYSICVEELSKQDASIGVSVSVHTSLCSTPIFMFGNEDQKKKYLCDLASGRKYGAFGLTEPNAGTDASGQQSKAVKDGDNYILNGAKIFITNSAFADTFVAFAMTDKSKGTKGISAFILEKGMEGFTVDKDIPRMGIRAASNCGLAFENVVVPEANLLGKEGRGFGIAMQTLDGGRIGIASQAVGIAQGAINETIKYVKERKQFGKRISQFQNTQFQLADMQTKVDAARLLVWRAACAKDAHENYSALAAMAKLAASEAASDVTRRCVQLFGGYGYSREYPVERMMRDAKITEIYEGTSEVQKMVISGSMQVK